MRAHYFRHHARGFTLIEIMLVCAIMGLIAAMALPNYLRARVSANEMVAIEVCRTLSTALEGYRAAQSPPAYPPDLAMLSNDLPPYLDSVVTRGTRQGYDYVYTRVNDNRYTVVGTPQTATVTGVRSFFVDESGVIRVGTDNTGVPIE